ncbi:MAG: hypothetical protein B7733_08385 [Myxococcales bacterium FL481]|nr:MAG: hypothetical protein B7733_08385 [Myxococcales bacterium FL481]
MRLSSLRATGLASTLALTVLFGCGYRHDSNAFFVENWSSEYEIVNSCEPTNHPRGGHMEVWIDPSGFAAFTAGEPLPDGSVLLKPQWDESSSCSDDPDLYTVMRAKTGNAWDWQTVGRKGDIEETNAGDCSSCHATCGESLMCTFP